MNCELLLTGKLAAVLGINLALEAKRCYPDAAHYFERSIAGVHNERLLLTNSHSTTPSVLIR